MLLVSTGIAGREDMHEDGPESNGPQPPIKVVDAEDADNNDPDMKEVMRVPDDTPIIVNTTSGRELIVKFSEDCYIAASLGPMDSLVPTAEALHAMVVVMADMRFGGLEEARARLAKSYKPEVDGT